MDRKAELLGMPFGTATSRLRKALLFKAARELGWHLCYRCKNEIKTIEEFSIEHKHSWMFSENPKKEFFNLDNIAFSHLLCNNKAGLKITPNGSGWLKGRPSPRRKVAPDGMAWCYRGSHFEIVDKFTIDSRRWNELRDECNPCRSEWRKQRYKEGKSR